MANNENGYLLTEENISAIVSRVISNLIERRYINTEGNNIGDLQLEIQNHIKDITNPHNVTKSNVGLNNVDNTSDIDKPVSTLQQEALDVLYRQLTAYADKVVADLIDGAPTTLDTLNEIADAMVEHQEVVSALDAAVGSKASQAEFDSHESNSIIHTTASEKQKIKEVDNKVSKSGDVMTGSLTAPSFIGELKGNSDTSGVAAKLGRGGNVNSPMTFNVSGQTGQPSWLWGTNDGANHYVWSPANFHVMKANRLRSYANSLDMGMDYWNTHDLTFPVIRDISNDKYHFPICTHIDDSANTPNERIVDMYVDYHYSPWRLVVRVSIDGVLYKRYAELKDWT